MSRRCGFHRPRAELRRPPHGANKTDRASLVSWWHRFGVVTLVVNLAGVLAAQPLQVTPLPDSKVAGLAVSHPGLPGNVFDFGTCEAVLDGNRDFGLFEVKLALNGSPSSPGWTLDEQGLGYAWRYPAGIVVRFRAEPQRESVQCNYTVINESRAALDRVHLHTCVTTTRAAAFFPDEVSAADRDLTTTAPVDDLTELYERVFLWSHGQRFAFANRVPGRGEVHLAFMRAGETPIRWAWWVNAQQTFDTPLIAVASKDGRHTAGLWFEQAVWASCNVGDERACFHLFPLFGRIAPGESASVRGGFYLLAGTPDDLYRKWNEPRGEVPQANVPSTTGPRLVDP